MFDGRRHLHLQLFVDLPSEPIPEVQHHQRPGHCQQHKQQKPKEARKYGREDGGRAVALSAALLFL